MVYNQLYLPRPCFQTFTGMAICQAVKAFLLKVWRYTFPSQLAVQKINRNSQHQMGNKVLSKCRICFRALPGGWQDDNNQEEKKVISQAWGRVRVNDSCLGFQKENS